MGWAVADASQGPGHLFVLCSLPCHTRCGLGERYVADLLTMVTVHWEDGGGGGGYRLFRCPGADVNTGWPVA